MGILEWNIKFTWIPLLPDACYFIFKEFLIELKFEIVENGAIFNYSDNQIIHFKNINAINFNVRINSLVL